MGFEEAGLLGSPQPRQGGAVGRFFQRAIFLLVHAALLDAGAAYAADCPDPLGNLVSLEGAVEVQAAETTNWRPARLGQPLCPGDTVRVGDRSRAAAALTTDNKLRLDQNTTLRLVVPPEAGHSWLDLLTGGAYFFSRKPQSLDVRTPVVNAAVEGTEFLIRITGNETLVGVVHGRIRATNAQGELVLGDGEAAVTTPGTAPSPYLLVRPLDAVRWAIYYPAILPFARDAGTAADQPAELRAAIDATAASRTGEAFAWFAAVPADQRGADFYLYRASALLSVGRADEASADLAALLALAPDNAAAHGLKAVIAIAQNDNAAGLADAQRAVELDPGSAPALIALSYAEQAQFQITAAREAAERATQAEPSNPLAWARLSELWLMQGWRDRSREAAERAAALAPDLERVRSVAGFAALTAIDLRRAREEFEQAIALNPGDPQPRLGLGLTTIRGGRLGEGRADLELAVLLDPSNALLRSYLGKAYFDEKRDPLATTQFDLAKDLDPKDPTPFFYSAIQKQTENRPVEALRDLEKSIALNDDRAVYRSRELLDSDRAARGASLGRIYDDLGFQQLGVNAATRSLSFDPASAEAHRFLSDIYIGQPRTEIARVSELLQAQLLQDVNVNPVQPSMNITNFNIITHAGPVQPGFNEYTPLFERNQVQLNATGIGGTHETWGNEAVISGLYDQYSMSLGQFHYQTDGFRDNYDQNLNIYNAYAQASLTPDFNVQGEFNGIKGRSGYLPIYFDPTFFYKTVESSTQYNGRIGARYVLDPKSTIISSFIYSNVDYDAEDHEDLDIDQSVRSKGYQGESSYIFNGHSYNIVGGFGVFHTNNNLNLIYPSAGIYDPVRDRFNINQQIGYVYSDIKPLPNLIGTVGLSFDYYKERDIDLARVNPKLGLQWEVVPNVTIRSALFRTVKPPLVTSRTIQPTQIAGFNQFFDDRAGTEVWRYGTGVDVRITDDLSGGIEGSERRIQANLQDEFTDNEDYNEQYRERLARAYLYWTPSFRWALNSEFRYDNFNSQDNSAFIPSKVETISFPLGIRYFDPSGFFGTFTWTFVHQDVNQPGDLGSFEGTSNFNLLDAAIGYRLPKRLGILSVQCLNLLNENFSYQDDSFREVARDQKPSRYIPERTVVGRITLNF